MGEMGSSSANVFEAAKKIVDALGGLGPDDQGLALRWAGEKLRLASARGAPTAPSAGDAEEFSREIGVPAATRAADIKSFVQQKRPKSDVQFATVVAYFHRFEAPERKDAINGTDLVEACRQSGWARPQRPDQPLQNAVKQGLLDRWERGSFRVNAVGENLVAMALPDGDLGGENGAKRRTRPSRARSRRKTGGA